MNTDTLELLRLSKWLPLKKMDPNFHSHDSLMKLVESTDVVVELIGREALEHLLWDREKYGASIHWQGMMPDLTFAFHSMESDGFQLMANYQIFKINQLQIKVFSPHSRFVDLSQLEEYSRSISRGEKFKRAYMIDKDHFPWREFISLVTKQEPTTIVLFAPTQYQVGKWVERTNENLRKEFDGSRKLELIQEELQVYGDGVKCGGNIMAFETVINLINGFVVTMILSTGYQQYDVMKFKNFCQKAFPHAKRIVRTSELPQFFDIIQGLTILPQ